MSLLVDYIWDKDVRLYTSGIQKCNLLWKAREIGIKLRCWKLNKIFELFDELSIVYITLSSITVYLDTSRALAVKLLSDEYILTHKFVIP